MRLAREASWQRKGSVMLRALLETKPTFTRSMLERRWVEFLDAHRLPRPELNAYIEVDGCRHEKDGIWRDERIAVEIDRADHDASSTAGPRRVVQSGELRSRPVPMTKLTLEYDGASFGGWAAQPGVRSIQAEVEQALSTIRSQPTPVIVAGRTDAGVHAWGQVVSHDGEPIDVKRINALLPNEIAALRSEPAPDGFDARRDAVSRSYCYRVLNRRARSANERGRALWVARPLDVDALMACGAAIAGSNDFTAFTPTDTEHRLFRRDVMSARWDREGDVLAFWIEARSFMRHMNRVLVGTMLEVAVGKRTVDEFEALLKGAPRSAAGATAPAHGLALTSVRYETSP